MKHAGFIPAQIVSGETIFVSASNTKQSWAGSDINFDDYSPADGYSLEYQFAAATPVTVAAVANGANDGWTLLIPATTTIAFAPGKLQFVGFIKDGNDQMFAVDAGSIDVTASPLRVSEWKARLTAIDSAIAKLAANPRASVSIEGISYSYRQTKELLELRDFIAARLAEDTANRPVRIIRARLECSH